MRDGDSRDAHIPRVILRGHSLDQKQMDGRNNLCVRALAYDSVFRIAKQCGERDRRRRPDIGYFIETTTREKEISFDDSARAEL